jgi:hypothetical protein
VDRAKAPGVKDPRARAKAPLAAARVAAADRAKAAADRARLAAPAKAGRARADAGKNLITAVGGSVLFLTAADYPLASTPP